MRLFNCLSFVSAVALSLFILGPASWNVVLASDAAENSVTTFSFRGHPSQKCKSFMLFENGGHGQLGSGSAAAYIMDLGVMVNTGERKSLGGSIFLVSDFFGDVAVGIRPRFRYWLSDSFALDITLGAAVYSLDSSVPMPGLISSASLALWELFSLDMTYMARGEYQDEALHYEGADHESRSRMFLGLSSRSYSTAAMWVIIGVAFIINPASFDAG